MSSSDGKYDGKTGVRLDSARDAAATLYWNITGDGNIPLIFADNNLCIADAGVISNYRCSSSSMASYRRRSGNVH